jgi:hypothetical protein
MSLSAVWFVASNITADGKYVPIFFGPQWTADGGVPSAFQPGPMPNLVGLTYYQASAACFANEFIPIVSGYRKIPLIVAGIVVDQSPAAGLIVSPFTTVGLTVAANPYLLVITQDEMV